MLHTTNTKSPNGSFSHSHHNNIIIDQRKTATTTEPRSHKSYTLGCMKIHPIAT